MGISNSYKGVTFSMGGYFQQGFHTLYNNVTEHFTIANALKVYSPHLKGYSSGISSGDDPNSDLNKAVPGSKAIDLMAQAKRLVYDLKTKSEYNFESLKIVLTKF